MEKEESRPLAQRMKGLEKAGYALALGRWHVIIIALSPNSPFVEGGFGRLSHTELQQNSVVFTYNNTKITYSSK